MSECPSAEREASASVACALTPNPRTCALWCWCSTNRRTESNEGGNRGLTLLEAAAGPSSSWLLANAMHVGTVEERQRIGRLETVWRERERTRARKCDPIRRCIIHHPRRTRKTAEAEEGERERQTDRRTDGRRRKRKMEDRAISTSGRGGRRGENGMSASRSRRLNIWLPTEGRGTEGVEWSNKRASLAELYQNVLAES